MSLRTLLAGLAGGIVIFFVGFITHGLLHLQSRTLLNIPDSTSFIENLKERSLKPGFYIYPDMPTGPDRNDPAKMSEASKRFETGPTGLLLVARGGNDPMLEMLGKEFVTNLLSALLAAWIVALAGADIGFGRRWLAVVAIGLIAWLSLAASYGIWYRFPHDFIHDEAICTLAEWAVAGLAIAAIARRPPVIGQAVPV
jgi:hypothetical protein